MGTERNEPVWYWRMLAIFWTISAFGALGPVLADFSWEHASRWGAATTAAWALWKVTYLSKSPSVRER